MNRTLSRGVGTALAALSIFSCSSDNLTGTNGLSTDDLSADATLIASVTVSFGRSSIAVGDTTTATATLRDWRGRILPNRTVTWTSSDNAVATVSPSGLVTGTGGGTAVITAARSGKTGSATITVTSLGTTSVPSVASVSVSLAATSLNPGQTTQATATVRDSANNVLTGRAVTWASGNTAVATVSSGGLVTAVAAGSSQITATSEGKSGSAALTVTTSSSVVSNPATVTDLAVAATDSTSATLSFTQADDGTGQPAKYDVRFAVAPISWGSATSVASGTCATPLNGTAVGSKLTCTVLGLKPSTSYNFQLVAFRGTMNQDAVYGSLSNVAAGTTKASTTTPPPVPVATVTVSPASATLDIGATSQLSATTRDANGNVLTGRVVTWTSANTAIATVSATGLVTAKAGGTTQVTATSEGKIGSASITVNAAPPPPPPPPPTGNEPSGMTMISNRAFNSTTASYAPGEDGWWDSDNGALAIVQDATAPQSPSNVARMTFSAGISGGYAPSTLERPVSATTIYSAAWVKFSSNWQSHLSGVNKILHFWIGGGNKLVITAAGYVPTGPLTARISLQGIVSGGNNADGGISGTYESTAQFVRGQWTKIEVVAVANTPGSANGSVKLYINGTLATQCSGIKFTNDSNPSWTLESWAPVWGGTGDTVLSTMYEYMDNIYISGK